MKKILLDSDVIRHFIKGDSLSLLPKIYPGRLVIIDVVKNELCRSKSLESIIHNFITFMKIEELDFSGDLKMLKEYASLLKNGRGQGESAVMAVALHSKDIVASSNLKDIAEYCLINKIEYITTMDILVEAEKHKIMTEKECDEFIGKVLAAGSKLPCDRLKVYKSKFLAPKKEI